MDFFQHQEQARRKTWLLIALFSLAVAAITVILNLFLMLIIFTIGKTQGTGPQTFSYSLETWLLVTAVSAGVILLGSLYRQMSLSRGADVADALGARRLLSTNASHDENVLLNVVEEMAIASGMPVPDVYVLDDPGINAFAAGYQPSDAVIGVTRGAIEGLTREQLQGVVAHEFSHIFNGDMRMNMRITAILYGILFIGLAGRMLLSSRRSLRFSRRRDGRAELAVMGIGAGLMLIGFSGDFFGRMIQAAVSRQREFLADASAVRFTRNPQGIAGALKVIGHSAGSRVHAAHAAEMSHFFFGQALHTKMQMFATHPPIDERIGRIEPGWNGYYLPPRTKPVVVNAPAEDNTAAEASAFIPAAAAFAQPVFELEKSAEEASDAYQAQAELLAIFMLAGDPSAEKKQQDIVFSQLGDRVFRDCLKQLNALRRGPARRPLHDIEKRLPALRGLSRAQYDQLNKTLMAVAKADGKITLYEWCLYRLVLQYLGAHFGLTAPLSIKYTSTRSVSDQAAVVMSYVAAAGHNESSVIERAWLAGMMNGRFLKRQRNPEHHSGQTLKPLNLALTALMRCAPDVKKQILNALHVCATYDHHLTQDEEDLIRVIAALLETPAGVFEHGRIGQ